MHTGDVGYFGANENLFVVDRKKDLIKYNALQIAPAEIEDVISSHPLVKEVGVIGVRDSRKIGEQVVSSQKRYALLCLTLLPLF